MLNVPLFIRQNMSDIIKLQSFKHFSRIVTHKKKISLQIGARLWDKFQLQLCRFGTPKSHPKSLKNQPRSPRPAQRPPGSGWEPFGKHVGPILASCWAPRGLTFELFRGARLLLFACCSSIAGALFLMRPLLRCTRHRSPKR